MGIGSPRASGTDRSTRARAGIRPTPAVDALGRPDPRFSPQRAGVMRFAGAHPQRATAFASFLSTVEPPAGKTHQQKETR